MGKKRRKKRQDSSAGTKGDDQIRLDGWANLATGLGYSRDKRTWGSYLDISVLDEAALENLYAGDDLAAIVIDALPDQALRGGVDLVYDGDDDDTSGLRRGIEQELRRVDTMDRVASALCWGRLYGGGAVLLGADDGIVDVSTPLDDSRVRRLRFLNDLERRDITPLSWYDDPREQSYGQPDVYMLTPQGLSRSGGVTVSTIHETRLIETYGARTPSRIKRLNRGWPLSVLQRVHEVIRDFEQAFGSVGHMLLDCSQGVLSQKGLIRAITQVGASAIDARMASIDTYRASNRMLVLDADGEKFDYVERTFSGIDKILALFMLRISSAARMPVTVLFGRSPAGLNATGESDLETWYAQVMSYQEVVVRPILERIVRIIAISLGSSDPQSWSVEFPSLWIEGPKDLASRRELISKRDTAYISAGVYEPEEVALARAQGDDADVAIDEDERRRQLELDVSKTWIDPAGGGDGAVEE